MHKKRKVKLCRKLKILQKIEIIKIIKSIAHIKRKQKKNPPENNYH